MAASASSEFIALCQSQVLLLTQALGATSTVVYLARQSMDPVSPTLVPLVAYPDDADTWAGLNEVLTTMADRLSEAGEETDPVGGNLLSSGASTTPLEPDFSQAELGQPMFSFPQASALGEAAPRESVANCPPPSDPGNPATVPPLVLPLANDGVVLGVVVSTRAALPWNREDYHQAERVANTLAIAWVMDQRGQWLQRQLNQRQLNQADQSETFHDLLHQFRNPLTALQTFGKLLLKRMQPEDLNQPIAEGIVRESRRLQDLAQHFDVAVTQGDEGLSHSATMPPVAGLLLPTATDSPAGMETDIGVKPPLGVEVKPQPAPIAGQGYGLGRTLVVEPGPIAEVVMPLLQSFQPIAQELNMTLVYDIPADLPEVWLDREALGEVLSNLLDNAVKYAPSGSLIWVTGGLVQHLEGVIYQGIAVGDTGSGIPLADQPHIFERHYRGIRADGDIPGTGLGLAIVQELVRGMGGHIDLTSPVRVEHWVSEAAKGVTPGPGTLFMVWLPTV
ncbi:MAG: sensor histidine kinase [Nodosilinea sp.]